MHSTESTLPEFNDGWKLNRVVQVRYAKQFTDTAADFNTSASLQFQIRKQKNDDFWTPKFPEDDAYVE
jgi:hypothetical protein